jgi:hypothetical protein
VVVGAGVKADLQRRFRDTRGRPPSPSELESELRAWKRDEALYREALRDQLDRDDATIRAVLADRVRARVAAGLRKREPSGAELDGWLATHRSLYEIPRRYDYESVAFPRGERSAGEQLAKYQKALEAGADPRGLGRSIVGGNLGVEDLQERFGPGLAARIQTLPVGRWHRLESEHDLLLVRVNAVQGGLPDAEALHRRLVADWSYAEQRRAVDQAVEAIVGRYRFEER